MSDDYMRLDDVMNLESGDHGGLMREFPDGPPSAYGRDRGWYWGKWDYQKVDVIAKNMEENGWNGPPICVQEDTVQNGHHRVIAAYMIGLETIPVTSDWSDSEDLWESNRELEPPPEW